MLFNSLLFIYLFLPPVLLLTLATPARFRNYTLLLASLVFYAWGGVSYTLVLVASILLNYLSGILIGRAKSVTARKGWFTAAVILNLGMLGVFKYTGFLVLNANHLVARFGMDPLVVREVFLPLGISFYTFKALSYLIGVKRGEAVAERSFVKVALYISLFPQLIAGPIDRYRDLSGQLDGRSITAEGFASGIRRFALGLFKKVILTAPLAYVADRIFATRPEDLSIAEAWIGAAAYTLQIYYDFSGYTDMAIGLGRMFGFRFTENFNFPYTARSVREFWKRWHITLSTWQRDYLFLPMAYSVSRRLKHERYLGIRTDHVIYVIATMVTFVVCGIWHGAAWAFVAWGLLHGAALSLERTPFGKWMEKRYPVAGHIYLLLFITATMLLFRVPGLGFAATYWSVMAGVEGVPVDWAKTTALFDREFVLMAVVAILGCTPLFVRLVERIRVRLEPRATRLQRVALGLGLTGGTLAVFAVMLLATMYLLSQTNTPFIYFRF
jgi:alginate O-acetyltransferase complex protein AlgI